VREERTVSRGRKEGFGYGFVHVRATMVMNEESHCSVVERALVNRQRRLPSHLGQ
jgi:hypothetical protein